MLLNNGGTIPQIQFGTYKMKGDECYKGVLSALRSVLLNIYLKNFLIHRTWLISKSISPVTLLRQPTLCFWSCTELTAQGMVNHPHQGEFLEIDSY